LINKEKEYLTSHRVLPSCYSFSFATGERKFRTIWSKDNCQF